LLSKGIRNGLFHNDKFTPLTVKRQCDFASPAPLRRCWHGTQPLLPAGQLGNKRAVETAFLAGIPSKRSDKGQIGAPWRQKERYGLDCVSLLKCQTNLDITVTACLFWCRTQEPPGCSFLG